MNAQRELSAHICGDVMPGSESSWRFICCLPDGHAGEHVAQMEGGGVMRWNQPMRFAYADPPYLGCGEKHYAHQHDDAARYDDPAAHQALIDRLVLEFDAWALSLSVPSLRVILPMCPDAVRIGAWVKPFASFKPNVNPGYCWEPVIFYGARSAAARGGRTAATVRDYVSANITLERGTSGAKPDPFAFWMFDFLGMRGDDEFTDLFPGSGAVSKAWEEWRWHNAPLAAASPLVSSPEPDQGQTK